MCWCGSRWDAPIIYHHQALQRSSPCSWWAGALMFIYYAPALGVSHATPGCNVHVNHIFGLCIEYVLVWLASGGMRPNTTTRRSSSLLRDHGGRGRRFYMCWAHLRGKIGPLGCPGNQNHIFGLCIEYIYVLVWLAGPLFSL